MNRRQAENHFFMQTWQDPCVTLPGSLLKNYKHLGIQDEEMMLIIQLLAFRQMERNAFPTFDELASCLSCDRQEVVQRIQRLMQKGLLTISRHQDPGSGMTTESYRLEPLFEKWQAYQAGKQVPPPSEEEKRKSIFTIFEEEFGRPLSPMECEMLNSWLDRDGCSEELVKAALKEAVLSGKLNFRYIDRILFEWQRNNIRTPKEAQAHALRFRERRLRGGGPPDFTFYNWLEEEHPGQ